MKSNDKMTHELVFFNLRENVILNSEQTKVTLFPCPGGRLESSAHTQNGIVLH